MSQDEAAECPLCMEPLELDDLSFYPCTCGYQICRFCWHRLRTDENGLCPACRKQYSEDPANFKPLSVDEMQQKAKNERKAKKQRLVENRKHLANVRVVQRNLVFVVGLPTRLACQEQLKRHECFGKFGKIHKVVVNQSTSYAGVQGPSASAYVTYFRSEDALRAIEAVNNVRVDGKTLKASLGTTKYCNHFLKGGQCPKSDCMYLHELGDEAASFTKEQMQAGKHTEYERRLHEQLNHTGGCGNNGSSNQRGGNPKEGVQVASQHHQQQHGFSQKEHSCSNNKLGGQRSSPVPVSERIPASHPSASPPSAAAANQLPNNNNNNNKQVLAKGGGGGGGGGVGVCGGRRSRHKSSECSSEEASSGGEEQLQLHHNQKSPATPLSERSDSPDLERLGGHADETPDDDDDDDEEDEEEEEEEDEEGEEEVEGEEDGVREDENDEDRRQDDEDEDVVHDVDTIQDDIRTSASAGAESTTGCNQVRARHGGHDVNHRPPHSQQQQQQASQRTSGVSKHKHNLQQQQHQHHHQSQEHTSVAHGRHLRSPSPPRHQQLQQQNSSPPNQYQQLENPDCSPSRQGILREDRQNHHPHQPQQQQQHPCDTPASPESSGDAMLRSNSSIEKRVVQQLQSLNQLSLGRQVHPSGHAAVQDHLLHQQQQQHHPHSSMHQQSLGIQQHHMFQQQQNHHIQRSSSREQLPLAGTNQQSNLVNDIELDFDPIYISRKGLADLIEREQHHPLGGSPLTHAPHPIGSPAGPSPNPSGNHLASLLPFGRMPPSRPSPPGIAPLSAPSGHLPGGGHHLGNQPTPGAYPPGLGGPMGPIPGLGAPPSQMGAQMPPLPDHPVPHGSPHQQGMRRAPPPGFGPPMPHPPQQQSPGGPFGPYNQAPPPPMGPPAGSLAGYYAANTNNDMTPSGSSFSYRGYGGGPPGVVIPGSVPGTGGHCDELLNMKEQQDQLRQLLPSVNISFGPPPHHTPSSSCASSMATGTNSASLAPPPGLMGTLAQQHNQRQQQPHMSVLTHHSSVHSGGVLPGLHHHHHHHGGGGLHGHGGWPDTFQDPAILSSSRHIAQPSATTTGPADQRPSPYF